MNLFSIQKIYFKASKLLSISSAFRPNSFAIIPLYWNTKVNNEAEAFSCDHPAQKTSEEKGFSLN